MSRRLITTSADELEFYSARYLFRGRITLAALTIIAGEPGLGKTTFAARIGAEASRGTLDGDTGRNILQFVREHILSEGRCIIIVTHDSRIYEFADRIMRMEDGKLTGFDKGNLDAQ